MSCLLAVGEAMVEELKQGSLSEIANNVQVWLEATNEAHFLNLIDWIEFHWPGLMLSRIVLGRDSPSVLLSSGQRFPVAELDFWHGKPVLGRTSSTVEKIEVNYLNQGKVLNVMAPGLFLLYWRQSLLLHWSLIQFFNPMCATHLPTSEKLLVQTYRVICNIIIQ